jgi:DNA-binding response OmpR family regulator
VVDDDSSMRDVIRSYLEGENFQVSAVTDGRAMDRVLAEKSMDLVILDLKLTNENGLDLMRGLGGRSDVPVILVTGHRRDEADRVVGLELGADDYIIKPFGLRELLARVRAVLRRSEAARARKHEKRIRYRFAGWELNMRTRELKSPVGTTTALTAGEFNLLAAFLDICLRRTQCTQPQYRLSGGYFRHPCFHAGGSLASIRMKAMRHGLPLLFTQAWLVPCCTSTSPARMCTSVSSISMSISPSSTMA